MSGFDLNWLNLREPLDGLARDQILLQKAARFIQGTLRKTIIDIGSGTGSTFRAVAPLAPSARWRLIDHDGQLLDEAARRHAHSDNISYQIADLNTLASLSLHEADLVCASAFFDLCSLEFAAGLADHLAAAGSGLYAALNYDGNIAFDPPHPDDHIMLQLFNRHQGTDKGFGPALGPRSGPALVELFTRLDYEVDVARSDWIIDGNAVELHRLFIDGLASAVGETAMLDGDRIARWLAFRIRQAGTATCRVGHSDILALPLHVRV